MLLTEINPFVRQAIINTLTSNTKYDVFYELRSADCRLFYIIAGKGNMIIKNKTYTLHPGDCILFQSGTRYVWQTFDQNMLHCITINFDYTRRFTQFRKPFHPVHSDMFVDRDILEQITFTDSTVLNEPIVLNNAHSFESTLRRLVTERYLGGDYSDELLSALLKSLIISIVRKLNADRKHLSGNGFELTSSIIQHIHNHYSESLSYDAFAELYHLNPIYMNRVFKKNTGVSLHAFLTNYRINTAMELLRSTNMGVKEIATTVGFSDFPHFIKTFKKATGKAPTDYRNSSE